MDMESIYIKEIERPICGVCVSRTVLVGLGALVEEDLGVVGELLELLHDSLVLVLSSGLGCRRHTF